MITDIAVENVLTFIKQNITEAYDIELTPYDAWRFQLPIMDANTSFLLFAGRWNKTKWYNRKTNYYHYSYVALERGNRKITEWGGESEELFLQIHNLQKVLVDKYISKELEEDTQTINTFKKILFLGI